MWRAPRVLHSSLAITPADGKSRLSARSSNFPSFCIRANSIRQSVVSENFEEIVTEFS